MWAPITRRDFVKTSVQAGSLACLGDLAFLQGLPPVSAQEAKVTPAKVRLNPDIEPLVGLIEDTDRDELLPRIGYYIRQGTSYSQILAALLLAGVRSIQPRPVGFKFHAVLVVNSAHLASLAAPDNERWLPLFWALDNFKKSQAQNAREGNWFMKPVDEGKLPPGHQAKKRFMAAMDDWDEAATDLAIASLVRNASAGEVIELFWRYGARDFRDIGHKAIYVANSWRTLQTIGWRHAEPVMRSLAYALLQHNDGNPAQRDDPADRPGRDNWKRLTKIRADWPDGTIQAQATSDVLTTLRSGSPGDACDQIVELLNKKVSPASIWDALFLNAGELIMRQPGIVGIHCVTSTNALYQGYLLSANDETRRFLMLQAASFLPLFRQAMKGRGKLREDLRIDALEKVEEVATGQQGVEEIFADVSKDRLLAARKTLALLASREVKPELLITAGRRLIFSKGNDSHDYKFSSAALEDYYHVTPAWRDRYLATSMFNLRGSQDKDNGLLQRSRAAFGA
jgi:hypothetical protein